MKSAVAQKWEGRWDQLKGRVREGWGNLTDDDVDRAHGSFDVLVGIIKEKTGETREEIEKRLNS